MGKNMWYLVGAFCFCVFLSYVCLNEYLAERKSNHVLRLEKLGFETNRNGSLTECPEGRVTTAMPGGRLGNLIWEYASVWAVVQIYSKKETLLGFIPNSMHDNLSEAFESLSLPKFYTIPNECVDLDRAQYVSHKEEWSDQYDPRESKKSPIILEMYAARIQDIFKVGLVHLRKELKLKKEILDKSQIRLREAKSKLNRTIEMNTTFIGIHHRGTDYPNHLHWKYLNPKIVTPDFYARAMEFMRRRHNNALFVVASDDRRWCVDNIRGPDVVVAEEDEPKNDLGLLASCNHSIISYGTFGTTGAILAGGDTVLFLVNQTENTSGARLAMKTSEYLFNWYILE